MHSDIAVLGAGIVGVSTALHLQALGRSVVLVDRRAPGEETSHGNAGLIQCSSLFPFSCPRNIGQLAAYALNTRVDLRYHWRFLPLIAPWLFQYWRHSSPRRIAETMQAMLPLLTTSATAHRQLIADAGVAHLFQEKGWLAVYRKENAFDQAAAQSRDLKAFSVANDIIDAKRVRALEPGLNAGLVGAVHWKDAPTVTDPRAVTKAYAELFVKRGGVIASGDARSLLNDSAGWSLLANAKRIACREAVIALGPWTMDLLRSLGYRIPLASKRGYHVHLQVRDGAGLSRPVLDAEFGYVMAPTTQGIRLTSGVEFARRDAPPTPVQLNAAERHARSLLALGRRVDEKPWIGHRPCLPDMRPVIGPAPAHKGLWFNFGHAHHGFTLGPIAGKTLAEMIVRGDCAFDMTPFAVERFSS